MFEISVPLKAAEDAGAQVLWGLNIFTSTPALLRVIFNHLARVSFVTPSWGERVLIKSLVDVRRCLVPFK